MRYVGESPSGKAPPSGGGTRRFDPFLPSQIDRYRLFMKFHQNRNTYIVALIALVNMIGYGIIIPILYSYSKKYGLSDFENGLLFAVFSVCQFFSTPIIGRLSDKYGRRPMLLVSIMGTAVSFFMMAFAPNALFLFLSRALDGLTAGNIPVAFAVISDSTKPEDRARAFGLIGSALNFGFVFGPAIAAFTIGFGPALPFIIAGIITTIAAILLALFLPETNQHMGEVKTGKLFDFKGMWHILFDPNIGRVFVLSLVFFLAFACSIIYGFQPYAINVLKITQTENAILFTIFGAVGLFAQNVVVHRVAKKFGNKVAFSNSVLLIALAFLAMFLGQNVMVFVTAIIVLAFANSIVQTLIPTVLSQIADAKSQGSIMGLNASYQSIGMIFGPLLGGLAATLSIPFTFLVGSGLILVCYLISFKIFKPVHKKESAF